MKQTSLRYLQDKNIPADDITLTKLAEQILKNPPQFRLRSAIRPHEAGILHLQKGRQPLRSRKLRTRRRHASRHRRTHRLRAS